MGVSKKQLRNKLKLAEQYVMKNPRATVSDVRSHIRRTTGVGLGFYSAKTALRRAQGRLLAHVPRHVEAVNGNGAPKKVRSPKVVGTITVPETRVAEVLREAKAKLVAENLHLSDLNVTIANDGTWSIKAAFNRQFSLDV